MGISCQNCSLWVARKRVCYNYGDTAIVRREKKDDLIRLDIDYWMLCEMVIKDEYLTLSGDDLLD